MRAYLGTFVQAVPAFVETQIFACGAQADQVGQGVVVHIACRELGPDGRRRRWNRVVRPAPSVTRMLPVGSRLRQLATGLGRC
ncbi:MAG: hypothetical protein MZV65_00325 [Chromatiales bacterium]|nr:hypothetical protein [Chromatiales bacterium]